MRTLITNDDGIDSPGIRVLARVAVTAGLDVVVAAPGWDSSGASASLTAVEEDGAFLFEERRLDGLGGVPAFAVQAAPGFITAVAAAGAFGRPPDLVLSGINQGPNTGHAVLHSGTVGAALTASTRGARAMAVSMPVARPWEWDTAAAVADLALPWLVDAPAGVVLNVNVPNIPVNELRGIRRARLASFGAVQANVTEVGKGYVKMEYSGIDPRREPDSDAALVASGWACMTPLLAVCEAPEVDLSSLERVNAAVG